MVAWDEARLTYEQLARYATVCKKAGTGRDIWGFIDGTATEVGRPDEDLQRAYYSGHKKKHCLQHQAIVTPDGLVTSLMGPFLGKTNDWSIVKETKMRRILKRAHSAKSPDQPRLSLYGDKAYLCCWGIIGPYKDYPKKPLTPDQAYFNQRMSRLRIEVEHAFGICSNYWSFSGDKKKMRVGQSPAAAYFFVGVLLTNILNCYRPNQISRRFGMCPPTVEEYLQGAGMDETATETDQSSSTSDDSDQDDDETTENSEDDGMELDSPEDPSQE